MSREYTGKAYEYHQRRREALRSMKGEFQLDTLDLEKAKRQYFSKGGVVTRLKVTKDSIPAVWGDFVKSKIKVN